MARPGPKPRAALKLVTGKTPGKRARTAPTKPPPAGKLSEPKWATYFPGAKSAPFLELAREEWRRVVPVLDRLGRMSELEPSIVRDYCLCVARLAQCEAEISRKGFSTKGRKNPASTIANQYRQQLKFYVSELGLSPRSREGSIGEGGQGGEEEDLYDT